MNNQEDENSSRRSIREEISDVVNKFMPRNIVRANTIYQGAVGVLAGGGAGITTYNHLLPHIDNPEKLAYAVISGVVTAIAAYAVTGHIADITFRKATRKKEFVPAVLQEEVQR